MRSRDVDNDKARWTRRMRDDGNRVVEYSTQRPVDSLWPYVPPRWPRVLRRWLGKHQAPVAQGIRAPDF